MTQQVQSNPAQAQSAKQPGRKPRLERVASLKPCEMPKETASGTEFYMVYVTQMGKQITKKCSKAVYQRITGQKLDYRKKSDFVLTVDMETDTVTHIVEQPKPDNMPGFKREDEKKEASGALVIALYPDGSTAPVNVPERVTEQSIQGVMDAICDYDGEILPGAKVGNHMVTETHKVVGATEIYVNPMPTQ